jgi:cytochrome P450
MVSTGNPELVRAILGAEPDQFEAFGSELLGPILGEESLMILSGQRHRAARKLLTPPFTLMTLLGAGHETSAVALAWACYWVLGDEAIYERLLTELRGVPDIEAMVRLPYLDAVCNETLRLNPIAPAILRRSTGHRHLLTGK